MLTQVCDGHLDRRGNVDRQPPAVDRVQDFCQFRHGAAADRQETVTPQAGNSHSKRAPLLFGNHDRIEPLAAQV